MKLFIRLLAVHRLVTGSKNGMLEESNEMRFLNSEWLITKQKIGCAIIGQKNISIRFPVSDLAWLYSLFLSVLI